MYYSEDQLLTLITDKSLDCMKNKNGEMLSQSRKVCSETGYTYFFKRDPQNE